MKNNFLENNKKTIEFYKKHKSKFNFSFMILFSLLLAQLVTTFIFTSSLVIGSSMEPTLSNGDKGISDGIFYKAFGLKRFDILIIEKNDDLLVKRLIAFPNETIKYQDGVLKINDEVIEEDFISDYVANKTGTFEITLEDDEYFVMGDNRTGNNSWDSRSFGPISYSQIKGRGLFIFSKCGEASSSQGCQDLRLVWPYFA